jgi:hypothetical protein
MRTQMMLSVSNPLGCALCDLPSKEPLSLARIDRHEEIDKMNLCIIPWRANRLLARIGFRQI